MHGRRGARSEGIGRRSRQTVEGTAVVISQYARLRAALGGTALGMGIYATAVGGQRAYGGLMLAVGCALIGQAWIVARRRRR
jgi:hypothetical protein